MRRAVLQRGGSSANTKGVTGQVVNMKTRAENQPHTKIEREDREGQDENGLRVEKTTRTSTPDRYSGDPCSALRQSPCWDSCPAFFTHLLSISSTPGKLSVFQNCCYWQRLPT